MNFWRSAAMLFTSTVEICIQHLGQVDEMVFATRRSYDSTVFGVVILSVCHTRVLWLIQRTYRRYLYTTWKGNPSSQMWFFIQLCSSWQDFNWLKGSRGLSAAAELLVETSEASWPWPWLWIGSRSYQHAQYMWYYQRAWPCDCSLMQYRNMAIWISWNVDITRSLNSHDSFPRRKFKNRAQSGCRPGPILSLPTISFELHANMTHEIDLEKCNFPNFRSPVTLTLNWVKVISTCIILVGLPAFLTMWL